MINNLLTIQSEEAVQKTELSRKITIDGVTKAYPVYRVRLDFLYYNDQNDRIATWISQYMGDHPSTTLQDLSREEYNSIIEEFIVSSNPGAIEKTRNNIALVNQREPGVILKDGRVIDGNRRFTCLRQLSSKSNDFGFFETVILDKDIENNKKQIKMLELQIQLGEDSKVDYNPMERLVGVYRDVVESKLLTVEEYARSTNESISDVKRRIEQANLVVEFLDFINMPKKYYIAREYHLGGIIPEIPKLLKRCDTVEMKEQVKELIFTNLMMHSADDNVRYIRDLAKMMDNGFFLAYLKEQNRLKDDVKERLAEEKPDSVESLKRFVNDNEDITDELKISKEKSLLKSKKREVRNKPSQIITKSISMLSDVDTNVFDKLTDTEKDKLKTKIQKLVTVADRFDTMVSGDTDMPIDISKPNTVNVIEGEPNRKSGNYYEIEDTKYDRPDIYCLSNDKGIVSLNFKLEFGAYKCKPDTVDTCEYEAFFVDKDGEQISDKYRISIQTDSITTILCELNSKASQEDNVYLLIRYPDGDDNKVLKKIPFKVDIAFTGEFGF